jgi:predicted O-methyltransferase YrrM
MKFITTGPFCRYAEAKLSPKSYYKQYMRGEITSRQFEAAMKADEALLGDPGFSAYNMARIALTPQRETQPSEKIVGYLQSRGLLPVYDEPKMENAFSRYRKNIHKHYCHGDFVTFIYPEDERLFYILAALKKPQSAFMAGAYYGYLAVWAMQALGESGGLFTLSDINEEVCALARENIKGLGYEGHAEVINENAEDLLKKRTGVLDMLVLDATGKHDDPRPEYRGKRIYGSLLKAANHLLAKGTLIFIHNMEPDNPEMGELTEELRRINAVGTHYDTYNGLGAYIIE